MTLTPWFCAVTQPPVRPGWYDVIFSHERRHTGKRARWDGKGWRTNSGVREYFWFSHHGDRWRGLLGDERGPFKE